MPIEYQFKPNIISKHDFYAIDYQVMGLVFSIHNELGRLWNEKIYQNELAYRCQKAGFAKVATEVVIKVSYLDFLKCFYVDLIFNDAVIYELKTSQCLTGEHQQQVLNYLFLLGMQHGKLINMRPPSVESRFVSTRLTPDKRYNYKIEDNHWQDVDEDSIRLKELILNLLNEWGAFLDTTLFYDTIIHFNGGEENVVKMIEAKEGNRTMGRQKVHLINPEVAFNISSMTKDEQYYEHNLRKFLSYASLKAIQWINFNHDLIIFKTIFR
ncbi:MAG TPA: GxxExxY protein [bacterium]